MRLKEGVRFGSRDQAMAFAALVVYSVYIKHGYETVITSVNDGTHSPTSLHPHDGAFDFRTKHLPDKETKELIIKEIQESLTGEFDVLLEGLNTDSEHGHAEFDPD